MLKERVAITQVVEQRLDEALHRLVGFLGGLESIVPRNSRVLIKPNFVFVPTTHGITHPELVEAVVRLVAECSPREIVIAEGSADAYTNQGFRFLGMYRIAARYGARLVDLNLEPGVRTAVPQGLGRDYIMLPKAIVESEVLVSLPVFKLWGGCPLSLSLKNLIGLYGGRYYGYNKDSDVQGVSDPCYGLPGEVGVEMGAHKPTGHQSICALNSVVKTDLAIIDALEGGDGQGHWIRLDTLIAGRNPVATDTVGLALAGYDAHQYDVFRTCAERGLGPCRIEEIEIVGERLEDAVFHLARLRDGVLEMPVRFCLNLLEAGGLQQIHRAFRLYGFLPEDAGAPEERAALIELLARVIESDGFYAKALSQCNDTVIALLGLIVAQGGTSGDIEAIHRAYAERLDGLYYWPAARTLTRLGMAYAVEGAWRNYYLLPEGLTTAFRKMPARQGYSGGRHS